MPVFSRPSTIGTGSGSTAEIRSFPEGYTNACTVLSAFSVPPSVPALSTGSFNLPMHQRWKAVNTADMIVVCAGGALLLYANAAGGHTWTGSITFEEGN